MKKHLCFWLGAIVMLLTTYQTTQAQCSIALSSSDTTVCLGDTINLDANFVDSNVTQGSLTSTFAAGNGHRGNMFDIVATNTITITSFDGHPGGNTDIEIYYKAGTHVGFVNNAAAWTLVGSATGIVSQGTGNPTPIPIPVNVTIPAGQTYAFYITSTDGTTNLNYTNGSNPGGVFASDANLQFLEGVGLDYPFAGSPFSPRVWNGNIHYQLGPTPTYIWSTGATTSSIQAIPSSNVSYSVTASTPNCTLSDSLSVMVSTPVQLGPDTAICIGDSVTFNVGMPGMYMWQDSSTGQTLITAMGGPVYVSYTDSMGCVSADTAMVMVNNLPMVNLGPDTSICPSGMVNLNAGGGFSSYMWSDSSTGPMTSVQGSGGSQTISIMVTDSNGCMNTDTTHIQVYNTMPIHLGADTAICSYDSLMLNAGVGFNSYMWSTMDSTQMVTIQGTGVQTISVQATDSMGCMSMDTIMVQINNTPAVNLGPNVTICADSAHAFDAGAGFASYMWSDSSMNQTIMVGNTPGMQTMSVMVTDSNGCMASDTVMVQINGLPMVNLGPNVSICVGNSQTLDAGAGFTSYVWSDSTTNQTTMVSGAPGMQTVSVMVTDSNSCMASDTVMVQINALPVVNLGPDATICVGNSQTLDAGAGFASYAWSLGDSTQTVTVNSTLGLGATTVVVTVADSMGCMGTDTIVVTVDPCLNINNIDNNTAFKVYPNPTSNNINIEFTNVVNADVTLYGVDGRAILNRSNYNGQLLQMDVSSLEQGLYMLVVRENNTIHTTKIMIQK